MKSLRTAAHLLYVVPSLCAFSLLAGCNNVGQQSSTQGAFDFFPINVTAPKPTASASVRKFGPVGDSTHMAAQIYQGQNVSPAVAQRSDDGLTRFADASGSLVGYGEGSYQLNFENADVASVCKAILGGVLGANYMIDPKVTGQVTLTSSRPIPRARLLPLLETALSSVGASIIREGGLYRVVPGTNQSGFGPVDTAGDSPGYGTTIIVAKYVSAITIAQVLEAMDSRPGAIRADPTMNYVLVQGTAEERKAAVDAAAMVDEDWLKSKSVAILPVSNSSPHEVIAELNRILDTGKGGLSQNVVELRAMSRLNAILAVSRRPDALRQVREWVGRLDRVDPNATGVKIYRLEYAQAKDVAKLVNTMFGGPHDTSGQSSSDKLLQAVPSSSGVAPASSSTINASASTAAFGSQNNGQSPFGLLKTSFNPQGKPQQDPGGAPDSGGGPSDSSGFRVTADPNSNTLFIRASAEQYKAVERAIRQLDRPPVQVDIEATIAEVTLNKELQYGVQFFLQNHEINLGLQSASGVAAAASAGLNLLVGSNPSVVLHALQNVTSVKVLSSPSLVVLDRQPAILQVGDQVPVLTQSAQSVLTSSAPIVSSVEYKDTGIILSVLPRINSNGTVTLDVEQQISAVQNNGNAQTLTPTISQRRIRSTVAVSNGQTVMLAGLISQQENRSRDGLPGLNRISFLRDLLSTTDNTGQRTELIVFIRPQIISTAADAAQVTNEFRNKLLSMRPLRYPH